MVVGHVTGGWGGTGWRWCIGGWGRAWVGWAEQCWVCKDGGKIAQNTALAFTVLCIRTCYHTRTHTHARTHAHKATNMRTTHATLLATNCMYSFPHTYVHSPPLFKPKFIPPLPRVDSGLLSSFFSYNWLMSSDQLPSTKPSPPTDGKVLRTALKCVEVRLCVCVCVLSCGPIKGSSVRSL